MRGGGGGERTRSGSGLEVCYQKYGMVNKKKHTVPGRKIRTSVYEISLTFVYLVFEEIKLGKTILGGGGVGKVLMVVGAHVGREGGQCGLDDSQVRFALKKRVHVCCTVILCSSTTLHRQVEQVN